MDFYPFDFSRDGELDAFERAAEFQFMDHIFSSDDNFDEDDDRYFDEDF